MGKTYRVRKNKSVAGNEKFSMKMDIHEGIQRGMAGNRNVPGKHLSRWIGDGQEALHAVSSRADSNGFGALRSAKQSESAHNPTLAMLKLFQTSGKRDNTVKH